jgi:hypothetical protein
VIASEARNTRAEYLLTLLCFASADATTAAFGATSWQGRSTCSLTFLFIRLKIFSDLFLAIFYFCFFISDAKEAPSQQAQPFDEQQVAV